VSERARRTGGDGVGHGGSWVGRDRVPTIASTGPTGHPWDHWSRPRGVPGAHPASQVRCTIVSWKTSE
jgi:hypothetical protein